MLPFEEWDKKKYFPNMFQLYEDSGVKGCFPEEVYLLEEAVLYFSRGNIIPFGLSRVAEEQRGTYKEHLEDIYMELHGQAALDNVEERKLESRV